ncbi:MAG: fibronectin type III domain-containing protein [Desulfobacteria bacterium]
MRKHGSGFFLKAITLFGIAVFALSACGGGGSDSVSTPLSPANLTADAGDNQVLLNWPSVSHAATYNVYYGTTTPVTKSSTKITGAVSAPRTVTGLTNGTEYFFAVSAVNSGGESALSPERSATPSATPPPGAPQNIRASAGDNQVTVSWDNVAGAVQYNIYYGTTAGVTTASLTYDTIVTSPHVVATLLNGTTYYFVVTAVNAAHVESAVSFEVTATPTATPPPAAPTLTSATAGDTEVTLAWGAVTGATSYNVYRGTASGVTKISGTKFAGVSSPYDATGLTNGTPYFFIVTAVGAGGESAASNERSATPTAPAAAFTQADLTGTWKVNMLRTSSDNTGNGWLRATGTANASGSITVSSFEDSTGDTTLPPAGSMQWTIDGSGVVSESGVNGDDNVHMTMTSNKNFIAGTGGNGHHALRIIQKVVSGTSYSNTDVRNKSFVIHDLMVGALSQWNHSDGTTDASGMISMTNNWTPSGNDGAQPNVGTISVNGSGTVTIDTLTGFEGFLSADKKTIVGAWTETNGPSTYYHLMIIQITGQTYAAADLVGTSSGHMLGAGNANFWAHYTATGASGGGMTFSSWIDSLGGTTPSPVTASISSSGNVTLTDPSFQFHGTMSYDKKFTVATQTNGAGIYSLSIMTR